MLSMPVLFSSNLFGAVALPVQQWVIGLVVAALGLVLLMPHATKAARGLGAGLAAIGVGMIFASLPWEAGSLTKGLFYVLTAITLVSALGAVASRAAIYCAVWFAASLLGVAGLLVLAGAQFIGVATIVVYAGAIVVTFLFVIMLAQPKGNESYDRVSWGSLSKPVAVFASAALVAASIFSQQAAATGSRLREEATSIFVAVPASDAYPKIEASDIVAASLKTADESSSLEVTLRPTVFPIIDDDPGHADEKKTQDKQKSALAEAFKQVADERGRPDFDIAKTQVVFASSQRVNDTLTTRHVEALGVNLFGNQLVAVQVAGVLLLVALVGAISILTHNAPAAPRTEAVA